jgi:branched-chain amino acid transport system substrate-binding protein
MKKLLLAASACALMAGAVAAEEVKIGILIGFTGPIESLTGHMANAAEAAMAEVNASGKAKNTYSSVRGDSTCTDAAAATAAAERMITAEGVKAIIGGDCSGVTRAVLTNVAMPNGIVMVSPSATSPALTSDPDNGLFFRTAPSDAREGEVMADILTEKGVKSIALTYSNSDYGKGLAEAIATAFTAKGGTVTINAAHDDGKADYSAEVAALAAAGKASSRPRSTPAPSPPSACRAAWWATACRRRSARRWTDPTARWPARIPRVPRFWRKWARPTPRPMTPRRPTRWKATTLPR